MQLAAHRSIIKGSMETLEITVSIVGGIIAILAALIGFWTIPLYRKLGAVHKAMRSKNDEIDAVDANVTGHTSGTLTNEGQRLIQVSNAKAPLIRELERLEQERQFIVDKLPFFK